MKYRIGILGGGNISESHLRAAMEIGDIQVSGVCGPNREKVGKLAEAAGVPAFSDERSFFDACPMDLVAIGSPSGLHASQGVEAASRGIHVLVEKPLMSPPGMRTSSLKPAGPPGSSWECFSRTGPHPEPGT